MFCKISSGRKLKAQEQRSSLLQTYAIFFSVLFAKRASVTHQQNRADLLCLHLMPKTFCFSAKREPRNECWCLVRQQSGDSNQQPSAQKAASPTILATYRLHKKDMRLGHPSEADYESLALSPINLTSNINSQTRYQSDLKISGQLLLLFHYYS